MDEIVDNLQVDCPVSRKRDKVRFIKTYQWSRFSYFGVKNSLDTVLGLVSEITRKDLDIVIYVTTWMSSTGYLETPYSLTYL